MPLSRPLLMALAALTAVSTTHAVPTSHAMSTPLSPSLTPVAYTEPTSLMGRHYLHAKRDPLILMDPALQDGRPATRPSPPPPPAQKSSKSPKPTSSKKKTRQLVPFPQYIAERAIGEEVHQRDTHDAVSYLSNVQAAPAPPPAPANASPPPLPGQPQYKPYLSPSSDAKVEKPKTAPAKEKGKDEGKDKHKKGDKANDKHKAQGKETKKH